MFGAPDIQVELERWRLNNPASLHFIVDGLANARDLKQMLRDSRFDSAPSKLAVESLSEWAQCYEGENALANSLGGDVVEEPTRQRTKVVHSGCRPELYP